MKALFFRHKNMQIKRERKKTSSKEISFSSSLKCLWKREGRTRIGKEHHAVVVSLATYYPPPPRKLHCMKRLASPAGMSLTKLSLAGNNLIIPGQEEFCK